MSSRFKFNENSIKEPLTISTQTDIGPYILGDASTLGALSIQIKFTGSGTLTVQWLCSNDGLEYLTPESAVTNDVIPPLFEDIPAGSRLKSIITPIAALGKVRLIPTGTVTVEKLYVIAQ